MLIAVEDVEIELRDRAQNDFDKKLADQLRKVVKTLNHHYIKGVTNVATI
jgi:hypothetical protein